MSSKMYERTYESFAPYHTSTINILLHLITTPLCLITAFSLIEVNLGQLYVQAILSIYAISLFFFLSVRFSILNVMCLAAIYYAAITLSTLASTPYLAAFFAASYFTQDLAHFIACEPTF